MLLVHSALAGSDDHGDTRSEATELVLGSPLAGRIDSEGDVDVFRLELAATAAVEIFTTGTLDTIGTLEGALGERLVRNSGRYYVDDNFYIATRLEAGTYYLRVSSNFGRTGSYVVEAKSLDVTDLVLGSPLAGRIDSEGDVDVFPCRSRQCGNGRDLHHRGPLNGQQTGGGFGGGSR